MLTDEMKADGWIEHDGGMTPPKDWDGGMLYATDGKLYWIPPGWTWANVAAYRPETPHAD